MLQKINKDRLEEIMKVIEISKIRFPVAEIVRKMEVDKGMVSAYLNGKKPISDKFYSTFMKEFGGAKKEETLNEASNKRIDSLIELSNTLANALSESHQKVIDTNAELVKLLRERKQISSAGRKNGG